MLFYKAERAMDQKLFKIDNQHDFHFILITNTYLLNKTLLDYFVEILLFLYGV